jgi:class 3 adenylate cyclase
VIAGLAALAAVTSALFAHLFIARHIRQLDGELRHIEGFALDKVRYRKSWLHELDSLSSALKRMSTSLSAFSLYVPTEVVRTLIDQGVPPRPGGETREITVMFADLPGFTELTERHGADVAPFLTTFLTLATEAIHREGGTVDKFIGDCIMGIWNAPHTVEEHAAKACRAALAIRQLMQQVERPDGRVGGSRVRIGIATGRAFVGNVGSSQRLSYTALGDIVNIASRLEALGKELETEITVSRETAAAAGGAFVFKPLGTRAIRGRKGSLDVFALKRAASAPVDRPSLMRPVKSPGNTDAVA